MGSSVYSGVRESGMPGDALRRNRLRNQFFRLLRVYGRRRFRLAGCPRSRLEPLGELTPRDHFSQQASKLMDGRAPPIQQNHRTKIQNSKQYGGHSDPQSCPQGPWGSEEGWKTPEDQGGCASSQQGGQQVPPYRIDNDPDSKIYRFPRVPECRDRENPKRSSPGNRNPHGTPSQGQQKQKARERKLQDAPTEPTVRPANGEMDPAVRAIEQHDADSSSKKCEDPAGLLPSRSQHQANHIAAHQRKARAHAHAHERRDCQRPDKISSVFGRVAVQPAECRHSDDCERRNELAG